jgi:exodeoxyribonuclease V beta subunit
MSSPVPQLNRPMQASSHSSSQVLDAAAFDLWGSRLIEASAGTGKTWTIAALYLRLVLGHGGEHAYPRPLRPSEILVMTFTRAATRELSDRIRQRLLNAAQCFREEKQVPEDDVFLNTLTAQYAPGRERTEAAWSLAMAAQSMDEASVHTIDAWCQRMLKEHAFDSGCLFDEELVADEESMRLEAIQDYWRQSCYPLAPEPLSQILAIWSGVDKLHADLRDLISQDIPEQAGQGTLAQVLIDANAQRLAALQQLKAGWDVRAQAMQDWLDGQLAGKNHGWNGLKLQRRYYGKWLDTVKTWATDPNALEELELDKAWSRLTPQGLQDARKDDAPPVEIPAEFHQFDALKDAIDRLPTVGAAVRLHAALSVQQRLRLLKRQSGSFGFADMQQRLHDALSGPNGARLRERILAQYPVALIDEFQDTSPLQYEIFDLLYQSSTNDRQSALLLIGDPKQSIYGFRGADIHSYLQARRGTTGRHYVLKTNFRSTKALVNVVNHWFAQADQDRKEGAFMYRQDAENALPFEQVNAQGRSEQLVSADGAVPAMTLVHDLELHNAGSMRKQFAARCAEQIVGWLNDPKAGFAASAGDDAMASFRRLRPADIAILVRTGKEATAVRAELGRRAVASVYLSDQDSVFESREAKDLVLWLQAVAAPKDVRLARAALATSTIGLTLEELAWLASNDEAFDARSAQLAQLHTVWQLQGVLAMLRQTLHQLGLASQWLAAADGERKLTNFLHLAELLQSASTTLEGEQALIRWLQDEMAGAGSHGDAQVVRLESDADLVKVITIHKSKGLEYPVVCIPYACSFRAKDANSAGFLSISEATGERRLSLNPTKDELALADKDRLREDLRLLYVALTRARHALWVGFSALKTGLGDKCITHKSGAGYLLGGSEPIDAPDWLAPLTRLAAGCSGLALQSAATTISCTPLRLDQRETDLVTHYPYVASFERDWTIGSFSRLARDLAQAVPDTNLSPIQKIRPADDELTPSMEVENSLPLTAPSSAVWHRFARGAESGNFLHAQLEWLAGEGFALTGNEPLAQSLRRRCERAGRAAQADDVIAWLTEVTQTLLPGPDASLVDLERVLPEMEFWLPAHRMQAQAIDEHCHAHLLPGLERPALGSRQLHGMLMGFADLVFEHGGKYWVLDYKSNYLSDDDSGYTHVALANAVCQHRYDVQAAVYLLALHRLLKLRLGAHYKPQEHIGGAVYFFLRGVHGPERGVCLLPVEVAFLNALDALLIEEAMSP